MKTILDFITNTKTAAILFGVAVSTLIALIGWALIYGRMQ